VIPDEPVRGRTPPPWYLSLSGIERIQAFSRGLLPWPPICRLLGMRTTHVAAGTVTIAMPASEACVAPNGQLEFVPLLMRALEGASSTALAAGIDAVPLRFTIDPFRPAWPRTGNLLARARVVNSSNLFIFAEVQVDDPDGRHIAQGSLQSALRRVEPVPPPPPVTMKRVEEPVYDTPDPYLRSFPGNRVSDERLQQEDGLTLLTQRGFQSPIGILYGLRREEELTAGRAVFSMPASEWFCAVGTEVSPQIIAALADMTGWSAAMTLHQPGQSMAGLDGVVRFLRPVRADGRRLTAETVLTEPVANLFIGDTKIRDADGQLVALHSGSVARLDAGQRTRRQRQESRRVLATLLFTDIVDSTGHAERLGDARWRALLEEHKLAVRREVSRCNGTEVDTAGDGFFVRFESPAQAIEAARAARQAIARLGVEIRAGIHTGECEIHGNTLAGMAVHIAARIQAAARPSEILVSSTVKDLAVGSTLRFADRGETDLKGVPDPWRLYAVVD